MRAGSWSASLLTLILGCTASPGTGSRADGGMVDHADAAPVPTPTPYAAMSALVQRSCAFGSCHGGDGAGQAHLNFDKLLKSGTSLTTVLNGVPSCQYPPMPRVTPFAPEHSWLMVKLTEKHAEDGSLLFTPDPAWDAGLGDPASGLPVSVCPHTEAGALSFGKLMPISGTISRALPEQDIAVFRQWIEAGAPSE
jgi:hypothetical protein